MISRAKLAARANVWLLVACLLGRSSLSGATEDDQGDGAAPKVASVTNTVRFQATASSATSTFIAQWKDASPLDRCQAGVVGDMHQCVSMGSNLSLPFTRSLSLVIHFIGLARHSKHHPWPSIRYKGEVAGLLIADEKVHVPNAETQHACSTVCHSTSQLPGTS